MLPKPIYEALPYLFLFSALGLMMTQVDLVILVCAWVMFTGGSIQWVLRSDARRLNKRVPQREKRIYLHEDIYESLPFLYIGGSVLVMRFAESTLFFAFGFFLGAVGCTILGIRITRRKISWIDDWRRYRGSAYQVQAVQRRKMSNPVCDQCLIRESCRASGLNDQSNAQIMAWLRENHSDGEFGSLRFSLKESEARVVPDEQIYRQLVRQKKYAPQCLVLNSQQNKTAVRFNSKDVMAAPATGASASRASNSDALSLH